MQELSLLSQLSSYVLLVLIGLIALIVLAWQINVLKGKTMRNPDGSADDWHEQKLFYGVALADIVWACPTAIVGIILVFLNPRWGYYLLSLVSFWFVWANTMTTATSLRFENPKITLSWFIVFPFGILVGLAYIAWTILHFETVFLP